MPLKNRDQKKEVRRGWGITFLGSDWDRWRPVPNISFWQSFETLVTSTPWGRLVIGPWFSGHLSVRPGAGRGPSCRSHESQTEASFPGEPVRLPYSTTGSREEVSLTGIVGYGSGRCHSRETPSAPYPHVYYPSHPHCFSTRSGYGEFGGDRREAGEEGERGGKEKEGRRLSSRPPFPWFR